MSQLPHTLDPMSAYVLVVGHSPHVDEPPGEYFPAVHCTHAPPDSCDPRGHVKHSPVAGAHVAHVSQLSQTLDPIVAYTLPPVHGEHAVMPPGENCPAAHCTQTLPDSPEPGGQVKHAPVLGVQVVHVSQLSHTLEPTVEYTLLPAHDAHAVVPGEKDPAGH